MTNSTNLLSVKRSMKNTQVISRSGYDKTMKELTGSIVKNQNKMVFEIELDGDNTHRKSQPDFSRTEMQNIVEGLKSEFKNNKLFQSCNISLFEIDWYDDRDSYETPVFITEKGKRKVQEKTNDHHSIPKDWGVRIVISFDRTDSMRMINSITEKLLFLIDVEMSDNIKTKIKKDLSVVLKNEQQAINTYQTFFYTVKN